MLHRITEWVRLEGAMVGHLIQTPCTSELELFMSGEQEGREVWWTIGPCPHMQSEHCLDIYLDHDFGKCLLDLPAWANHCLSGKNCACF